MKNSSSRENERRVILCLHLNAVASMIVGLCEVMSVLVALGKKVGSYHRI